MPSSRSLWGKPAAQAPRRTLLLALFLATILTVTLPRSGAAPHETAYAAPTAPLWSTSYYMATVSGTTLYNLGCELGRRDLSVPGAQDNIVVLDFGMPAFRNGAYGTILFNNTFAATEEIAAAAQQFGKGYYYCTGSDLASYVRIAIGTSNYGRQVTYSHGRAWAQMVNQVAVWLYNSGYSSQVHAAGASDMEMSWNSPPTTRAWVDGYSSANWLNLYNYGDAAGCPPYGSCGTSSYPEWTQDDVWYISWGAKPAWPLPEIYLTNGGNAQQWYRLSLYAYLARGGRMHIAGTLTQYQACQQVGCHPATANTPQQGWSQLWDALNADPRTAQSLRWSSDIRW
ncbi:MAG: hypothetical protein HY689_08485 [Chloroflexi bacterium]|nr:hypothetical protein [Chloroflexota bacterium]